jgi:hypothetical protein
VGDDRMWAEGRRACGQPVKKMSLSLVFVEIKSCVASILLLPRYFIFKNPELAMIAQEGNRGQ